MRKSISLSIRNRDPRTTSRYSYLVGVASMCHMACADLHLSCHCSPTLEVPCFRADRPPGEAFDSLQTRVILRLLAGPQACTASARSPAGVPALANPASIPTRFPRFTRVDPVAASQRYFSSPRLGAVRPLNRTEVRIQLAPPSRRVRTIAILQQYS